MNGHPPASSTPDKRRGWAAAKTFLKNSSSLGPPPVANESTLAVPSATSPNASTSPTSYRTSALNSSATSRTSEDSSLEPAEDSIRLVRRSALVSKRQASGTSMISARRASRAGGRLPRSATEELASQLDGALGGQDDQDRPSKDELPLVREQEESPPQPSPTPPPSRPTSLSSFNTDQVASPSPLDPSPPPTLFDSPVSETVSPAGSSVAVASPLPPTATPLSPQTSLLKSPTPSNTSFSKQRLTLPPLNTQTVLLPPSVGAGHSPLPSPSQAHWKSIRDVVVGATSGSTEGTPTSSPGAQDPLLASKKSFKESYPPERGRAGDQQQQQRGEDREGGFFRKGFAGGFRGVADQAMQLAAGTRERERGKATATGGSSTTTSTVTQSGAEAEAGRPARRAKAHPQYARFESEISAALMDERRNRLRAVLSAPALASALGVPVSISNVPNASSNGSFGSNSRYNTFSSHPTHSSSRSNPSSIPSGPNASSSTSKRHSTLYSDASSSAPPLSSLLKVLHVYIPYATQPWAQPLPCAAEILIELGRPFAIGGGAEQGQGMSLEVFTLIAKNWRSGTREEEGDRWAWCLQALKVGDEGIRSRAVPLLVSLLAPTSPTAPIPTHPLSEPPTSPLSLQSLLISLIRLNRTLVSLSSAPRQPPTRSNTGGGARAFAQQAEGESTAADTIARLIGRVRRGEIIRLDRDTVRDVYLEKDVPGHSPMGEGWDPRRVSEAVAWEAVVLVQDTGDPAERRATLRVEVTAFWPELFSSELGTPTSVIHRRALLAFLRISRSRLLRLGSDSAVEAADEIDRDRVLILNLVRDRVLPQIQTLKATFYNGASSGIEDLTRAAMGLLVALCLDAQSPSAGDEEEADIKEEGAAVGAWALLEDLWREDALGWKAALASSLTDTITSEEPSTVEAVLLHFVGRDDLSAATIKTNVPVLFERLLHDPPAARTTLLPLLLNIRSTHPQIFYRPLFSCATTDKPDIVHQHRAVLGMLADTLGAARFWLHDPEMIAMVICGGGPKSTGGSGKLSWGKMKLGQTVVLTDLTSAVQAFGEDEQGLDEQEAVARSRFFEALEARIAVLVEARERTSLLPFSHRSLLATLLSEIRTLTQSLRRAPWLARAVAWALESHVGATARPTPVPTSPSTPDANPFLEPAPRLSEDTIEVDEMAFGELAVSLHRLRTALDPAARSSSQAQAKAAKRATTTLLDLVSPITAAVRPARPQPRRSATSTSNFGNPSAGEQVCPPILLLLVAVYSLLSMQDLSTLGPVIYRHHLNREWDQLGPAVFLLSLAAERTPSSLSNLIAADGESSDAQLHISILSRLSTVFSWRARLQSEPYIVDRHRRRPFKTAKELLNFVPTDAGIATFVPTAVQETTYLKFGASLPASVRTRLAALGWDSDQKEESSRSDWERMPLSLLSGDVLEDSQEDARPASPSRPSSPTRPSNTLTRRRSATDETSVLPPVVSTLFVSALGSQLAAVLRDATGLLGPAGRETLLTLSREDASLVVRPMLSDLSLEGNATRDIFSRLRILLSAQHDLPPAFSHFCFNHLAGFLKGLVKVGDAKALETYSAVLPLLADLAPQVSELSIRELRRNKADLLCLPTGAFWFDKTAPRLPMFPRQQTATDKPGLSTGLHEMVAIRTAQNMLLLSILKRDRKEAYTIKKTVSSFLLPRVLRGGSRASRTYVPERQTASDAGKAWAGPTGSQDVQSASRLLSRSWLLVVQQVFASLNRNYNDRVELAHTLEGVNEILSAHWDDLVIVGRALQIYMTASTRFRRLFNSASAFTLILPPIFLAYSQAESIPAIRDAVEYAFKTLFNVHQESLVFQTLAAASAIVLHKEVKDDAHRRWISKHLFQLLRSLDGEPLGSAGRAVGIRGGNEVYEREALISLVNDSPEIILSDIRAGSRTEEEISAVISTRWEEKSFPLADVVRLILTVIAHDPCSPRAESFLRVLRHLAVNFLGSGLAGDILREGVEALGNVFVKTAPKARERTTSRTTGEAVVSWNELDYSLLPGQANEIDWFSMRIDYLWLVHAFAAGGGTLSPSGLEKTMELVPGLLKESGAAAAAPAAAILREYTRATLLNGDAPSAQEAVAYLRELAPLVRSYADLVDFSDVLVVIEVLLRHPHLRQDPSFTTLVVGNFVLPSLQTCSMASAAGSIFPLAIRSATVNLIARLVVFLPAADTISLVVREPATPAFLAGVVLPLSIALKSLSDLATDRPPAQHDVQEAHVRAYKQLLDYAVASCKSSSTSDGQRKERGRWGRRSPSPSPATSPTRKNVLSKTAGSTPERRGRQRSGQSLSSGGVDVVERASAATVVFALQIVKVILVKAPDVLERYSDGTSSLVGFLRTLLDSVDGRFLQGGERRSSFDRNSSASSSRAASPSPQGQLRDRSLSVVSSNEGYTGLLSPMQGPPSATPSLSDISKQLSPSVLDASAWSLMELLVSRPSPVAIALRAWMHEKAADASSGGAGTSLFPPSEPTTPTETRGLESGLEAHADAPRATMATSPDLVIRTVRALRTVQKAFGLTEDGLTVGTDRGGEDGEWTAMGALARIELETKLWTSSDGFGDLLGRGGEKDTS